MRLAKYRKLNHPHCTVLSDKNWRIFLKTSLLERCYLEASRVDNHAVPRGLDMKTLKVCTNLPEFQAASNSEF